MKTMAVVLFFLLAWATAANGEDLNVYRASWIVVGPDTLVVRIQDAAHTPLQPMYFHGKLTMWSLSLHLITVVTWQLCWPDTAVDIIVQRGGGVSNTPVCDSLEAIVQAGDTLFVNAFAPLKGWCDVTGAPCPQK